MTTNEKITLVLSSLAVLVAASSIAYDIWQDVHEADEVVVLNVAQRTDDYIVEIRDGIGVLPALVTTDWIATLANNGTNSISIVSYDLRAISDQGEWFYSGLNLGLSDSDGNPIRLPLTLDPGNATRFLVRVGYPVQDTVYETISRNHEIGDRVWMATLQRELAREGRDLWGNRVEYRSYEDSTYTMIGPSFDKMRGFGFHLILNTARGGKVSAVFAPYLSLFQS